MPNFTSDWFSHNIPAWRQIFSEFVGWDASAQKTAIEIGAYEGRSTLWILENILQNPDSKLHTIDTFADEGYEERFRLNVAESPNASKVSIYKEASIDVLVRFLASGAKCDFIYVDGSHRAADVLEDLILSFHILAPGGLLICDDYLGGAPGGIGEGVLTTPKIACDAFSTIYRDRITVIPGQPLYQLAMLKKHESVKDDPTSRGK